MKLITFPARTNSAITISHTPRIISCLLASALFLALAWPAMAQISQGGTPVSFRKKAALSQNIPLQKMPPVDVAALLKEDAIREQHKDIPWRFGYNIETNFNLSNSGKWETLANGDRIWRLKIHSKGALSINLTFSQYYLPKGAQLFIYSEDRSEILGAFTAKNNKSHGKLGTTLIHAETITLEYFEPRKVTGKGKLEIGKVTHGYKQLFDYTYAKGLGTSGACNNNVICPEGDPWRDQIRSVAIVVVNGNGVCSGALVNSTCEDGTPYFLTANHCLTSDVSSWVFRFNWESPDCDENLNGPTSQTISGATTKANSANSDFALLELSSTPPADYNVYYAGWDATGASPDSQVCIHHPDGDLKKISFDTDPATSTNYSGAKVWQVGNWEDGTTEPGSSGSPLFDQNKKVIGQLFGGTASCTNDTDDNFGRFAVSWDAGGTPGSQLKNWLDECGYGITTIDGYDPNAPRDSTDAQALYFINLNDIICDSVINPQLLIRNKGINALTSLDIYYGLEDSTFNLISWTGNIGTGDIDTVDLPSSTLPSETYNYTAYVTNPNGTTDQDSINDTTTTSFTLYSNPQTVTFVLKTDDYGSETSWAIKDTLGNTLYSGDGYPDQNKTYTFDLCLDTGCYDLFVYDSFGDGLNASSFGGTDGDYYLLNAFCDTLAKMNNADFGYEDRTTFCLSDDTNYCDNFSVALTTVNDTCEVGSGSITVAPDNGCSPYTYAWNDTTAQTSSTATGLFAGTYTVTVTEASGCSLTTSTTITTTPAIESSLTVTNAQCDSANGSITVNVTQGTSPYNYTWNDTSNQTTATATGLSAGTYEVTVTDTNNCAGTFSKSINNEGGPVITIDSLRPLYCYGEDRAFLTAAVDSGAPPYQYLWSNDDTTATADSLTAGTYYLTVTDSINCIAILDTVVSQPDSLYASFAATDISCFGENNGMISTTLSGGVTPYSYSWDTGDTTLMLDSLSEAVYTFNLTDANGCFFSDSIAITEPLPLSDSISTSDATCNAQADGSIMLAISGGTTPYAYNWSEGSTSASLTGISEGEYFVTITDNNGCSLTDSATVKEPAPILITAAVKEETEVGNDGAIDLTVTGGTPPYSYNWDNGITEDTSRITGLSEGVYTVTVIDDNNCIETHADTVFNYTGIETISLAQNLLIYPNPTTGIITVELQTRQPHPATLRIFNVLGENMLSESLFGNKTVIDLSAYENGMYFLQVVGGGEMVVERIVLGK